MKRNYLFGFIFMLLFVFSCNDDEIKINEAASYFVVDGWIEEGKKAEVYLSRNTPYFTIIDSSSYFDLLLMSATVSIWNDEKEEKMRGFLLSNKYTSRTIKGEAGKTYHIQVTYHDTVLTASTTIPEKPKIDSAWFEFLPDNDTVGLVKVKFTDDVNIRNYYRILVKVEGETDYLPTASSVINDYYFQKPQHTFPVTKNKLSQIENLNEVYFKVGDTVVVKLCAIDEASYKFWYVYQFESLNAVNPFASSSLELEGNINGPGVGIWSGYSYDTYVVIVKKK